MESGTKAGSATAEPEDVVTNEARRGEIAHLVLQISERADVMDLALFVKSADRLCPDRLPTACNDLLEGRLPVCGRHGKSNHVAAIVALTADPICAHR